MQCCWYHGLLEQVLERFEGVEQQARGRFRVQHYLPRGCRALQGFSINFRSCQGQQSCTLVPQAALSPTECPNATS